MSEYCVLYQNARDKALDRGFQMDLVCPVEEICDGKNCIFLSEEGGVKNRLEELRRELDDIQEVKLHGETKPISR